MGQRLTVMGPATLLKAATQMAERSPDELRAAARSLASRGDVPSDVRQILRLIASSEPLATAVAGRHGFGTQSATGRPTKLPPHEKAALDRRMGIPPAGGAIQRRANKLTLGVMSKEEASRICAERGIK